jgi:hypothetical protein
MTFREPTLTWVALYLLALSRCLIIFIIPRLVDHLKISEV